VSKQILDFFPLQEVPPPLIDVPRLESQADLLKRVQETLIPQKTISKKDKKTGLRRPGESYKRDRNAEELTVNARAFLEIAGKDRYAIDPLLRELI
jgi:hypothetical protein